MENKLKLILVGDTNVGKTALLNRKHNNIFNPTFSSTLGVDFHYISVRRGNRDIKIYLWDTAGQEKFANLINVYFRNLDGAMIIYDITNRNSYDSIEKWIDKINFFNKSELPIIIVGTKTDLEKHRMIHKHEVTNLSKKYDYITMECSAKDNDNVDETFDAIIDRILKTKNFDTEINTTIRADLEIEEKIIKKNCCTIL
tara:strand:+ start:704 stop:1300 length:597 start_codon:yes stop_codon:yes gene_type:complete